MFGSTNDIFALIADITQCFWRCETARTVLLLLRPLVMAASCMDAVTLSQQESPANARVTRDSSACMKTPMVEN